MQYQGEHAPIAIPSGDHVSKFTKSKTYGRNLR